ncbi:MAG: hypothetical protein ABEJ31_15570 [Haloarculaceae archaeon]
MEYASVVPALAALVIVSGTLLSGPAVGPFDFTHEEQALDGLGTGSLTVESASLPATAAIARGAYGDGGYYLKVPPATLRITETVGRPVVGYGIEIPNRTYSRESLYFPEPGTEGTKRLTLSRDTFDPDTVSKDHYKAQLRVIVRVNHTSRVLAARNVTVEVRR